MSDTDDTTPAPEPEEKQGFQFPSTMTVLVIVTFLVWLAAFLIPSGTYQHDENGVPQPGSYTRIDSPQDFGDRVGDFFLAPVNGLYGLQNPETGVVHPFGVGSLFGAFVGAFIVGFVYTFGVALLPDLAYVILFLPMILVIAFRPRGLFGKLAA